MSDNHNQAGGAQMARVAAPRRAASRNILDLVDVNRLRRIIKQFSQLNGIAVGLVDHTSQQVLLQHGPAEICQRFHRRDEQACHFCRDFNRQLTEALGNQEISVGECPHGLIDGATPVIVGGEHVADLYIGQVLFKEPDVDSFRGNARRFGFDEEAYLAALGKVKVVDKRQFDRMLQFMANIAEVIGDMGVNYLRIKEQEEQSRRVVEKAKEPIAIVQDAKFQFVNPAALRLFGCTDQDQLVGHPVFEFLDDAFHDKVRDNHFRRVAGEDVEVGYEVCIVPRCGGRVWAELGAEVIDYKRKPAVLVAIHDITERKHAEGKRQELIDELNAVNEELNATNEELIATNEELSDTVGELNRANEELNSTYEELNSTYEELHSTYEELARTEEEVRVSEEYYRALIENAADGVVIIDERMVLTYESHSDGRLLGYADGELLGMSLQDKVHPDDLPVVAGAMERLIKEPEVVLELQVRILDKQDRWRVVEAICQNLFAHPRINGIVVNYRDITARREAEVRLKTSEERYRELVDNMSEGMVTVDQSERLTFANPAAEQLFGCAPGGLVGRNLSDFTDASTYAKILRETDERSSGKSSEYEIVIRRPDGTERQVLVTAAPMQGIDGEVIGSYGLLRDITESKLAVQRLRESEEQFRALVENSPDIIVRYDSDCRILYVNPVIQAITGESPEEMVGKTYRELDYNLEYYEPWEKRIRKVFATGLPARTEIMAGKNQLFEWRLNPVFGDDGSVQSVLGTLTDITERKKLMNRLIRDQKDESMLTLAGGIAHDFNNILIGVLGSASILHDSFQADEFKIADSRTREEAMALCSTVITSSQRMSDLTNKLLSYARGGSFQAKAVDLAETINDSLVMVRGRIPSNMKVDLSIDEGLWPVNGDAGQLHQVWLNLIINAEESMPVGGELRINASNAEQPVDWQCPLGHDHPAGKYVHVTVADDGEGMDDETIARIFEPFFSTKFQGRGLGLAAVNGIVGSHGGCIYANSRPGAGSTFHVYLPSTDEEVTKQETEELAEARPGEMVLVIDDEEIVRLTARRMLQRRGFQVLTVSNAADGLQMLVNRGRDIDLVMFDMHMPRVSGLEFFRALRQLNTEVRAVAISGYNEAVALQDMDTSQLDAFIQKPFTYKSLVAKIRQVLDKPDKY